MAGNGGNIVGNGLQHRGCYRCYRTVTGSGNAGRPVNTGCYRHYRCYREKRSFPTGIVPKKLKRGMAMLESLKKLFNRGGPPPLPDSVKILGAIVPFAEGRPRKVDGEVLEATRDKRGLTNTKREYAPMPLEKGSRPKGEVKVDITGLVWCQNRLVELLAAGWTESELFKKSWPLGLAWMRLWANPTVTVSLAPSGEVVFDIVGHDGTVRQVARPSCQDVGGLAI